MGGAQALHDCRIARDQGIGDIHGFIGVLSSCGHAFGDVHSQKVPGCRIDGILAIDWAQALRREAGDVRRINARPPPYQLSQLSIVRNSFAPVTCPHFVSNTLHHQPERHRHILWLRPYSTEDGFIVLHVRERRNVGLGKGLRLIGRIGYFAGRPHREGLA